MKRVALLFAAVCVVASLPSPSLAAAHRSVLRKVDRGRVVKTVRKGEPAKVVVVKPAPVKATRTTEFSFRVFSSTK